MQCGTLRKLRKKGGYNNDEGRRVIVFMFLQNVFNSKSFIPFFYSVITPFNKKLKI